MAVQAEVPFWANTVTGIPVAFCLSFLK